MRTLDEVLNQLINFANKNENIRGLVLQGSYVNKKAPIDIFSDLDPLFYCKDVTEFTESNEWKEEFGQVISYFHDAWDMKDNQKGYTRLTLYKDGFKIDFGFQDISLAQYANDMPLYKVYLDKDKIIPKSQTENDDKFYIQKPSEQRFQDILRDFFFDTSYVIKTIYREEITFNQYMMYILHKKINHLLSWYVACQHDFKVNLGVQNRYIKQYLSDKEWMMLQNTYSSSNKDQVYKALMASFELVHYLGTYIAKELGFTYPQKHEEDMYLYCKEMKQKYL